MTAPLDAGNVNQTPKHSTTETTKAIMIITLILTRIELGNKVISKLVQKEWKHKDWYYRR